MKHLLLAALAFFPFACSSGPAVKASEQPRREPPAESLESQYVAAAESADAVAEVTFEKGSTTLSPSEKAKLQKAVEHARKHAPLRKVEIVAWSDSEYPGRRGRELPSSAKDLADRRGDEIRKAISELSGLPASKASTFNMAKRSKTLDAALNADDYRIKGDLEEAGLNPKDGKAPKFAGKAIVLILDEGRGEKTAPVKQERVF